MIIQCVECDKEAQINGWDIKYGDGIGFICRECDAK